MAPKSRGSARPPTRVRGRAQKAGQAARGNRTAGARTAGARPATGPSKKTGPANAAPRKTAHTKAAHSKPAQAGFDRAKFLAELQAAITPDQWALICGRAVAQAILGDPDARRWLTKLLMRDTGADLAADGQPAAQPRNRPTRKRARKK